MKYKFQIDDITWNDLDMDEVCSLIDISESSVGYETLRSVLRTPLFDSEKLKARCRCVEAAGKDSAGCEKILKIFSGLGKTKKNSFHDYIFRINELKKRSSVVNYILAALLIAAIILIFIVPVAGIIAFVIMVAVNISVYFKIKAEVEGYFNSLKYLVSMVICANRICRCEAQMIRSDCFAAQINILGNSVIKFSGLKRMSWLITNSISGSLIDVVMDYIRMLFHVDLIKFNSMINTAAKFKDEIDELFYSLGEIESDICIAKYREKVKYFCVPEFSEKNCDDTENKNSASENKFEVDAADIYHPLIADPVPNNIKTSECLLLTGSNASGKSTFLKAVAVNQIFAQTICTCLATKFTTFFCRVYSSMALADNISENESYFVVEIKSLKRIFDAAKDAKVMCFIDEILRGTNTVERIAASSQLMKFLSGMNTLIFAATHDTELTQLLSDSFVNYHFSEQIKDDEVIFDYKLRKGPSLSGNAIKLLKVFDFPEEAVRNSADTAAEFIRTGSWI